MSLLENFLLLFESNGLDALAEDTENANKELDNFEDKANKAEKASNNLSKNIVSSADSFKRLATTAMTTIAPFIVLGKAATQATQFASDALEIAEAAKKANMSLEAFQQKENGYALFTKDDVRNAQEYELVMRDIRMGGASISANLSRMLLPALIAVGKVINTVMKFLSQHEPFIKAFVIGITALLTILAIPAIIKLGVQLWTALAPIMPFIILIGLLALAIEDLVVWINGGQSAFGDLWDNIFGGVEGAKKLFDDLKKSLKQIWEVAKPVFENIAQFLLKVVYEAIKLVVQGIGLIAKGLQKLTSKTVEINASQQVDGTHASGLDYVPFDGYIAQLHKGERVQTAQEANDWRAGLLKAKKAINFTANYPLNSIPLNALSNTYNNAPVAKNITIGDITIQTQATDSKGIAQNIADYIKEAVIDLDDGMLA